MRIRRAIIIPAILALSAAGSILAGSAVPAAAAQAPSVHVVAVAPSAHPNTYYVAGELTWRTTNGLLPIQPIQPICGRPSRDYR